MFNNIIETRLPFVLILRLKRPGEAGPRSRAGFAAQPPILYLRLIGGGPMLVEEPIMIVDRTEYKGQPVLILKRNENDKYPFSFGLSKARLIIEGFEEIKKFVAENDNKEEKK